MARREVVDPCDPQRSRAAARTCAPIDKVDETGLLQDTLEGYEVRVGSVVMIAWHCDHGFACPQCSESGRKPPQFMELLIHEVSDQTNDIGRPRGNPLSECRKFVLREEETDMKIAE